MTTRSFALIPAILLSAGALVHAGVGFNYGGNGGASSGRPFNFAVCATSPASIGTLTAEEFTGEGLGPGSSSFGHRHRDLQLQRYLPIGSLGSFTNGSSNGFAFNGRQPMGSSNGSGTGASSTSSNTGAGGGGSIANEVTTPDRPFNTGYCWCPGRPCGDDDDDDDGGTTTGDDDDDTGGGGGDPDPSVVPEPGSFALWALAGALLVGVTRRQTVID